MPAIKILAIDDHQLYLEGIRTALSQEPDFQLVATSQDPEKLIPLIRKYNPAIVLLDLQIQSFDAPETIRKLSGLFPVIHFVALTGSRDEVLVRQVALAGASGYLLKESIMKDDFPNQLRRIYGGTILFDQEVVHALIKLQSIGLTPQEQDCLSLMAKGLTNAGIAEALGLSRKRVANVLSALYAKLDIDGLNDQRWVTRVVAVREALNRGLIGIRENDRPQYR